MKTLDQHNAERRAIQNHIRYDQRAGIACDVCGSELYYLNLNMQLASNPPMMSVNCENKDCEDFYKIKYKVV